MSYRRTPARSALVVLFVAIFAAPAVAAEDFRSERRICDAHLNATPIPRVPKRMSGRVSRYASSFAALCEAMDKRQAADAVSSAAVKQDADLGALQTLAPSVAPMTTPSN